MWPIRWIMRVLRFPCRSFFSCAPLLLLLPLLAYLSLFGLLSLQLADSTSDISGLVIATEVSGLRKRSDTELNFLSTAPSSHVRPRTYDHELLPYFDNSTATNVTVQIATMAYLHCRVRQLGDKVVSWLRRRDFHILTVGLHTYSSDQRFQMIHQDHTDDWTLQIKFTQGRDAGVYECQVSSDPPISHIVVLNVVVAKAEIIGSVDMYFKSGSTITLTCLITQSPDPPAYVFWYHDSRMINYDTSRGGISVKTQKGDTTVSNLVITNAQRSDSGNYTCYPANAEPTSVTVHVLNGHPDLLAALLPTSMNETNFTTGDSAIGIYPTIIPNDTCFFSIFKESAHFVLNVDKVNLFTCSSLFRAVVCWFASYHFFLY